MTLRVYHDLWVEVRHPDGPPVLIQERGTRAAADSSNDCHRD
jgi:hypothetical protein